MTHFLENIITKTNKMKDYFTNKNVYSFYFFFYVLKYSSSCISVT